jgi:succinyl-diaminopimelate desuccinylase
MHRQQTPTINRSTHKILADLIAMPTITSDRAANHAGLNYIESFLTGCGMHVKRNEWNGVESLIASTKQTKTPTVCFFGHIDVVPAPAEQFRLTEHDGRYYGRGVLDMKGPVAAILGAVQQLKPTLSDYDFTVVITTDEEIGGFDSAAKLAEEGFRPKMMIVPDGGSNWNMERFAKGIWHITLKAQGQSAHASRPWEGENAIDKLVNVITQIKTLFGDMSPDTNTINVGTLQGGNATNQIPSSASAGIDMRFSSQEDQARIMGEIKSIVTRGEVQLTSDVEADPVVNDPANPYLSTFASCTEKVIGRPVEWITSYASNDSRFFAKYNIPCAISYPPGSNHHGPGEYIEKDSLLMMQQIFVDYLNIAAITG